MPLNYGFFGTLDLGLSIYTLKLDVVHKRFCVVCFPKIGTAISAASVFVLALESTQRACVTAMIIFTLGEVMWSPKLMELCVTVGEEGNK